MGNKNVFLKSLDETDKRKLSDFIINQPRKILEFLDKIDKIVTKTPLLKISKQKYWDLVRLDTPLVTGNSVNSLQYKKLKAWTYDRKEYTNVCNDEYPSIIIKYSDPQEVCKRLFLYVEVCTIEKDRIHNESTGLFGLSSKTHQLTKLNLGKFYFEHGKEDLFDSLKYSFDGEEISLFDFEDRIKETPISLINIEIINLITKINELLFELLIDEYNNLSEFKSTSKNLLKELDKDNNGQLDFIEGGDDYLTLLKKHQIKIIEIDRTYIQQFIKISNYLSQKKQNLRVIFERVKDSVNQNQLDELGEILKQEIHTYNIILLNSLHMINSLVEDDMITFYEIYERFDKLSMFTSNWENQVTEKLEKLNVNLIVLMKELREVGNRIESSIENLSFVTEESTRKLTSKMSEIDSTLQVGNLLNLIQTYQMYKVNKNTKSLREKN